MSERDGRTARAGGEVSWSAVASSTQPSSRASSIVNPSAILYAREDTRDATYISWLSSLSTTTIARARSPSREFALVRSNELKTPPPAGHGGSPWPKTSSSPGSAAKKAVHAVTELEDLFNGPASVCE